MGSVKKVVEGAVTSVVQPVNAVVKLAQGDVKGATDSLVRGVTAGTVGLTNGSVVNASDLMGKTPKLKDAGNQTELEKQADKTSRQRQALFMTEGDILGEEVESVGKKKRGNILGN